MKSYVEVAATIHKLVLVEVEHDDDLCEDEIADLAVDAAFTEVGSAEFSVDSISTEKPSKNNMAIYDEFVEV